MVKKDITVGKYIQAAKITVITDTDVADTLYKRTYIVFKDQLVSVLYLSGGTPVIYRGRVDKIIPNNLGDPEVLVLDTSHAQQADIDTLLIKRILEINPIDHKYPDLSPILLKSPPQDWEEVNKEVSAPSAIFEFRFTE